MRFLVDSSSSNLRWSSATLVSFSESAAFAASNFFAHSLSAASLRISIADSPDANASLCAAVISLISVSCLTIKSWILVSNVTTALLCSFFNVSRAISCVFIISFVFFVSDSASPLRIVDSADALLSSILCNDFSSLRISSRSWSSLSAIAVACCSFIAAIFSSPFFNFDNIFFILAFNEVNFLSIPSTLVRCIVFSLSLSCWTNSTAFVWFSLEFWSALHRSSLLALASARAVLCSSACTCKADVSSLWCSFVVASNLSWCVFSLASIDDLRVEMLINNFARCCSFSASWCACSSFNFFSFAATSDRITLISCACSFVLCSTCCDAFHSRRRASAKLSTLCSACLLAVWACLSWSANVATLFSATFRATWDCSSWLLVVAHWCRTASSSCDNCDTCDVSCSASVAVDGSTTTALTAAVSNICVNSSSLSSCSSMTLSRLYTFDRSVATRASDVRTESRCAWRTVDTSKAFLSISACSIDFSCLSANSSCSEVIPRAGLAGFGVCGWRCWSETVDEGPVLSSSDGESESESVDNVTPCFSKEEATPSLSAAGDDVPTRPGVVSLLLLLLLLSVAANNPSESEESPKSPSSSSPKTPAASWSAWSRTFVADSCIEDAKELTVDFNGVANVEAASEKVDSDFHIILIFESCSVKW